MTTNARAREDGQTKDPVAAREVKKPGAEVTALFPAIGQIFDHACDEDLPEIGSFSTLDRLGHALLGRFTLGISPAALSLAFADWATHLALSPGKQQLLYQKALRKAMRYSLYLGRAASGQECEPCIEPLPQDRRFRSAAWQQPPFNWFYQGFLLNQQFWHVATSDVRGVTKHHEEVVTFTLRQMLDVVAPSNFIATNPELLQKTIAEGGQNLWRGAQLFLEDWQRAIAGKTAGWQRCICRRPGCRGDPRQGGLPQPPD